MSISTFLTVAIAFAVVFYAVPAKSDDEGNMHMLSCIKNLKPCYSYLHTTTPPPPPSCCEPMKEIFEKNAPCICTVFDNPVVLKTLNLTKENALDLPKACGANPDLSLCDKKDSSSPRSSPSTSGGSSVTVGFIGLIALCVLFRQ